MKSKSSLAIELSKLKLFENANVKLEQYPTDSEIAADVLWKAYMNGDIEGKTIVDAGCGTGILGIGCLLLGAKKVYFVDIDKDALKICKENLKDFDNNEIINKDISEINIESDVLIQNPPFGSQNRHADRIFLEKAITYPLSYSFHMNETKDFVEKTIKESKCKITHYWKYQFPLKKTMDFHKKKIIRIEVGVWRLASTKHIKTEKNIISSK